MAGRPPQADARGLTPIGQIPVLEKGRQYVRHSPALKSLLDPTGDGRPALHQLPLPKVRLEGMGE